MLKQIVRKEANFSGPSSKNQPAEPPTEALKMTRGERATALGIAFFGAACLVSSFVRVEDGVHLNTDNAIVQIVGDSIPCLGEALGLPPRQSLLENDIEKFNHILVETFPQTKRFLFGDSDNSFSHDPTSQNC